ncbi:protein adenylyltransferase SelO [Vibrio salinus]|uniref:protein adenylyltransferase SelO n=1 Tax=Vibrio salinus TaxID=2899784 RepID=UPI001E498DD6|nr:YdiU family protein [Vibrio salinus]MCE0492894.1 YdiU family protein [Vibrio salinus]
MSFDQVISHRRYASLPESFYTRQSVKPLLNQNWIVWNRSLARTLRFPEQPDHVLLEKLTGITAKENFSPLAMKYAGHQFGFYNPDLGDGRGLLLTEIEDIAGDIWDLHLKGAGTTPYSRMGDGRAVLRSTIREYLCSEALHFLGIPTTRSLGMIGSDTTVYRETAETGAFLLRIAKTHVRFGHFEHLFYTQKYDDLRLLTDKVMNWYFPQCQHQENPYLNMFGEVIRRTASMIAFWQAYGFCHGVMNTDNMSIVGETFDFGPYAFMDEYHSGFICNHSDYEGRYAFNRQPQIALWNLTALAHALSPLIDSGELEESLASYEHILNEKYSQLMRRKFGLMMSMKGDSGLFQHALELLESNRVDYCVFFRTLSSLDCQPIDKVIDLFVDRISAEQWIKRYILRCEQEVDSNGFVVSAELRCQQMRSVNPKYILRNYLAQQAIQAAEQGDYTEIHNLLKVLSHPYDEQPEFEDYAKLPPEWGKHLEISCSS